jgi:SAM-dependent methyltransferase
MHAQPDWWRTFFSGLPVEMWLRAVPDEVTRREADFIQAQLQVPPPARILDVPCGGGRHSLALAAAGYQMTGVDISPQFLEAARSKATEQRLSIQWDHREMNDLPWRDAFDGAFCFGNSFGYATDGENASFLWSVAQALKPGARFLIDYPAVAEVVLAIFQERSWHEMGDILFLRDGRIDPATGRMTVEHTYLRGGQIDKRVMSQRIYTFREMCLLLKEAGFVDVCGFGSFSTEPFAFRSKQLLLVATKGRSGSPS